MTGNNKNIFWVSAAMVLVVLCIGGVVSDPSRYGDIFPATVSGLVQQNSQAESLAGISSTSNSGNTTGIAIDAGGNDPGEGTIVPRDGTGAVVDPAIAAADSGISGDTTYFDAGSNSPGMGTIVPQDGIGGVVDPDTTVAPQTPAGEFPASPITEVNSTNGADTPGAQGAVVIPEFPTIIIPVTAMAGFLLLVRITRKN